MRPLPWNGTRWLGAEPRREASLRLFCLPYAGGSAHLFRDWGRSLPVAVDVCPVHLPGRGKRLNEPAFRRMAPLVDAAARELRPYLDTPYALFGHSMGAMIAFELARALQDRGAVPACVIAAGRRAPHLPRTERTTSSAPQAELLAELARINAAPAALLADPEAMTLLLPLVRADFELVETYEYVPGSRLRCPLHAIGGLADADTPPEQIEAWRTQAAGRFSVTMVEGDHFFLERSASVFLPALAQLLRATVGPFAPLSVTNVE